MRRRAAYEEADDATYLTPRAMAPGAIVVIDLDRFEEVTRERGYDEYKPNDVTGLLTMLVEGFAVKHGGVIVYGLDHERGTEEALIEIPFKSADDVADDLVEIAEEIAATGVSVTIVALDAAVDPARMVGSRRSYRATPFRRTAVKELERWKRRGGGVVVVNGTVMWRLHARRGGP